MPSGKNTNVRKTWQTGGQNEYFQNKEGKRLHDKA